MFLHMDYNTIEKNETKEESYLHIYILVASEKEGWVVIQSPALKETLNKTINRGKTVIELPKLLKSTNITGVENKGINLKASVPVSVFGYNEELSNRKYFMLFLLTVYLQILIVIQIREQLIPINKWGNEFIVPFLNFKDPKSILRIVANESNTRVLVVDNSTSTSRALSHGNFIDIQMTTDGPLYVNSNRPIQVSLIVNGAFSRSRNGFMSLVPSLNHYKDVYWFIVPRSHMHENYELGCWEPGTIKKTRIIAITAELNVINDILYDNSQLPVNSTVRSIHVGDKTYSTISFRATEDYHTLHSNSGSERFGVIIYGACYSHLYGYGFPGGINS
ncbi:unnamed protein product [Mytilus coruscus]|uniref:IgGFc-binding protein N-terminal domain-containing protein n=1 Tax=Mytilus coruscus TaxID=42192 RepID=A0A6J8B679_MYTCO|nr:unnamed protein product [Mytilus coruscus]